MKKWRVMGVGVAEDKGCELAVAAEKMRVFNGVLGFITNGETEVLVAPGSWSMAYVIAVEDVPVNQPDEAEAGQDADAEMAEAVQDIEDDEEAAESQAILDQMAEAQAS